MIPSQVRRELEDTVIQWMLTRSTLLQPAKEKGHRALEMVVSSAVELIFKETAMLTQPHARAMTRKANRASHGPRGLAKERTRKVRETENPKENQKENPTVPKVRSRVKPRTLV